MRYGALSSIAAWVVLIALGGTNARASQQGIIGFSGKFRDTCSGCHDDGEAPVVEFEGPASFAADTPVPFRFIVRSQDQERQRFAGFNVAASDGLLRIDEAQNGRVEQDELTHNFPQSNDEAGEASWTFEWCVPIGGTFTLFGCGNSVNGNGNRSGDAASAVDLAVRVTPPAGDINCDGRRSAADVTAVFTSANAGLPGVCESPGDGAGAGATELETTIGLLYAPTCQF